MRGLAVRVLPRQCRQRAPGTCLQEHMCALIPEIRDGIVKPHRRAHMACPVIRVRCLDLGHPVACDRGEDRNIGPAQFQLGNSLAERCNGIIHHMAVEGVGGMQARDGKTCRLQLGPQRISGRIRPCNHAKLGAINGGQIHTVAKEGRNFRLRGAHRHHHAARQPGHQPAPQGNQRQRIAQIHDTCDGGGGKFTDGMPQHCIGVNAPMRPLLGQRIADGENRWLRQ